MKPNPIFEPKSNFTTFVTDILLSRGQRTLQSSRRKHNAQEKNIAKKFIEIT